MSLWADTRIKELMGRVAELERRVAELEAREKPVPSNIEFRVPVDKRSKEYRRSIGR